MRNRKPRMNRNSHNHLQRRSLPTPPDLPVIHMSLSTGRHPAPLIPTPMRFSEGPPFALCLASNCLEASLPGLSPLAIRCMATPLPTNFDYPIPSPADVSGIMPCSLSPAKTRLECTKQLRSSGARFDASRKASWRGRRQSSCRARRSRTCEVDGNRRCRSHHS